MCDLSGNKIILKSVSCILPRERPSNEIRNLRFGLIRSHILMLASLSLVLTLRQYISSYTDS